jgi:phosphatidylinositol alpha-mannosyltransferase
MASTTSFGNVVAEASAVGRPVVVSDIGAFRDLVQDGATGRVVAQDDGEAWVAALVELLRDRERARSMGEAGSRHVGGLSDPARVAAKTLAAHEHAIDRFRRSQRAARPRISWPNVSRSRRDPNQESPP